MKVHHATIVTTDVDAGIRFWRDGLGFEVQMDTSFEGDWPALFDAPSDRLRSVFLGDPAHPDAGVVELVDFGPGVAAGIGPGTVPATGFFLLSVYCAVDEVLARLADLGLGGEPRRIETFGVTMVVVTDPNGVRVELIDLPVKAVVLGAGIGGMAAAVRLLRAGIDDFVILERGDGIGGTWRWNTYPGAACDVPSHLYSLSFAPNPDWTSTFARQPEILAYLERVADDFGIRPHLRLGQTVTAMRWSDDTSTWTVSTAEGATFEAGVVISALGTFTEPKLPDVEGLDSFAGELLHSARWDHTVTIEGRRVGVIGTGASAVQIIPTIAPVAAHTTVFQRTAAWIVPRKDPAYSDEEKATFRATPSAARRHRGDIYRSYEERTSFEVDSPVEGMLEEFALDYLATKVADPDLRAKLTPDYRIGCKRVLPSSAYLPAMQRDDVALVTDRIERVVPGGVVTADGTVHELDVLICATGFDATGWLKGIDVAGRGGRPLREAWSQGARAHLGITVSGFPNLFLLYGPNTNQPGNSLILILEAQAAYAVRAMKAMARAGATSVDVRPEVQDAYVAAIDEAMAGTVWQSGCRSYFHDEHGRVATQLPHPSRWYWRRTLQFHPDDHDVR